MTSDAASENILPNLRPWTFWAKWSSPAKGTWHPLLFHLTDVAMCAEAMWDDILSPAWRARLAAGLGLPEAIARRWVIYLAGLHDLGKACPGFQLQLHLDHIETRLRAAGLRVQPCEWVPHGTVSTVALKEYLPQRFTMRRNIARACAVAVGGHHGVFPTDADLRKLPDPSLGDHSWQIARECYADWLAELLGVPHEQPPIACDHATAVMLAGFVSVVDWIGSSEGIFPHGVATPEGIPDRDPSTYLTLARARARFALARFGWAGWSPSTDPISFRAMFPDLPTPRPVQRAAIELATQLDSPGLVIIEEQMGEGKTEAAAYLADTWTTRFGQRGMYFALPTQATSNQMFDRVRAFLRHRYPADIVNLQLLHGHAALSHVVQSLKDESRSRLLDLSDVEDVEGGHRCDGSVVAAEWFASGKRALLAPFGVGTVDQALLAALQVKHFFVRMYGLSSKTIIIDEVHAYDTYMSVLIERLLEWLGAMRAPVILLSATLPASRRQRLLDAYIHGAGWGVDTSLASAPYPRLTWISASSTGAQAIPIDDERRREIQVEWIDGRLPDAPAGEFALGERLAAKLADGGCCVVICNTVRRAQAVYTALKPFFPGKASDGFPQLDLFHARFLFDDRAKREQRSLQRFGKDGPRPHRAVLVATQVVEQSLDLDFDLMVSDLAPVDLVLQRLGRLHRHARPSRPEPLSTPRLLIIQPEAVRPGDVPTFDRGSAAVYDPHILLASWLALCDRDTLRIPDDIEPLITQVYEHTTPPAEISPELRQAWLSTRAEMERDRANDEREASLRYIKRPSPDLALADVSANPREEENPELHPKLQALTRLTEPNVTVVCLVGTEAEPRLALEGPRISLTAEPTLETIAKLLGRSVTLSDRRVVFELLRREPPKGWQKSALLRRHRVLVFSPDGVALVGKACVRLDPDLGVVVEGSVRDSEGREVEGN